MFVPFVSQKFQLHSSGAATDLVMVEKPHDPSRSGSLSLTSLNLAQSGGFNNQRPIDQLCVLQLRSSGGTCRGIAKVGGVLAEGPLYLAKMIVWVNQG